MAIMVHGIPVALSRLGLQLGEDGTVQGGALAGAGRLRWLGPGLPAGGAGAGGLRLALPLAWWSCRYLRLPFSDVGKIHRVLPLELEDLVVPPAGPLATGAFVVGEEGEETIVLAVALDQGRMPELALPPALAAGGALAVPAFSALACRIAARHPDDDLLYLFRHPHGIALAGSRQGRLCLLRHLPATLQDRRLADAIRHTVIGFTAATGLSFTPAAVVAASEGEVAGLGMSCLPLAREIGAVFPAAPAAPGDLFQADAAALVLARRPAGGVHLAGDGPGARLPRLPLAAAGVLFLLAATFWTADNLLACRRLQHQADALAAASRAVFLQAMPGVRRVVDPVAQLRAALAARKAGTGVVPDPAARPRMVEMLADITEAVPDGLVVDGVEIGAPTVAVKGSAAGFTRVDQLKGRLEEIPWVAEAEIATASLEKAGGRVGFEIFLRREGSP